MKSMRKFGEGVKKFALGRWQLLPPFCSCGPNMNDGLALFKFVEPVLK